MANQKENITIIGDGGWGTTLAVYLAKKGCRVTLWGAFPDNIRRIKNSRVNAKFLPGVKIPKSLIVTGKLSDAIPAADLLILAVPSEYIIPILNKINRFDLSNKSLLSVIKGIDNTSLMRMSQVISKALGHLPLAVLSGPTIAIEVAKGIPSSAVIASRDIKLAKKLQKIFNSESFRIYTNTDIVGVELGGSFKNIIAIACGVCDGLGYGTNTKAAILSRGLVEMSRLGKALGGKQKTFSGLAGLGDLVTTCFSPKSRNRHVGEYLGQGKKLKRILASMNMVAEGVATAKAVHKLSKKLGVPMPITTEVYNILYKNKKPLKAVSDLMTRKTKSE